MNESIDLIREAERLRLKTATLRSRRKLMQAIGRLLAAILGLAGAHNGDWNSVTMAGVILVLDIATSLDDIACTRLNGGDL